MVLLLSLTKGFVVVRTCVRLGGACSRGVCVRGVCAGGCLYMGLYATLGGYAPTYGHSLGGVSASDSARSTMVVSYGKGLTGVLAIVSTMVARITLG